MTVYTESELSLDPSHVREVVQELLDLHHEDLRLAKRLLTLQERVDALDRLASAAIDSAAAVAPDDEAVDRAVSTVTAAMRASEEEFDATIEWALHLERSVAVTGSASELLQLLS